MIPTKKAMEPVHLIHFIGIFTTESDKTGKENQGLGMAYRTL